MIPRTRAVFRIATHKLRYGSWSQSSLYRLPWLLYFHPVVSSIVFRRAGSGRLLVWILIQEVSFSTWYSPDQCIIPCVINASFTRSKNKILRMFLNSKHVQRSIFFFVIRVCWMKYFVTFDISHTVCFIRLVNAVRLHEAQRRVRGKASSWRKIIGDRGVVTSHPLCD